ncbi:hypothetical protein [Flavobacterium sp.]
MELRKVEVQTTRGHRTIGTDGKSDYIAPKKETGYFHCWEHYKSEEMSEVRAVVELQDGTVGRFEVSDIKFLDKPE